MIVSSINIWGLGVEEEKGAWQNFGKSLELYRYSKN